MQRERHTLCQLRTQLQKRSVRVLRVHVHVRVRLHLQLHVCERQR